MALALTMLAGTIVTVRGFEALANQSAGLPRDHALTMHLTAPPSRYRRPPTPRTYNRVLDAAGGAGRGMRRSPRCCRPIK
jgi:hypothetical protein